MVSLRLGVYRQLLSLKTVMGMCKVSGCSNMFIPEDLDSFVNVSGFSKERSSLSCTIKFLNESGNHDNIKWHKLLENLQDMKVSNPSTKILQACIRLNRVDFGISYYNYVINQGKQFSLVDLMFFSKLLGREKTNIKKHEELLMKLYDYMKEYMKSSHKIREGFMEVFVEIPSCYSDIVASRFYGPQFGNMPLIKKALELNQPDIAFHYMGDLDFHVNSNFLEAYINFCCRQVVGGKFSVDLINKLVYFCERHMVSLNSDNLLPALQSLVNALMEHGHEYHWSVSKCEVNHSNSICSNCGLALLPKSVTNEEFKLLKESVFNDVFIRKNVFLSSTESEVEMFLEFLKSAKPYDVVLDGLNLLYREKRYVISNTSTFQNYFLEKGLSVLVIGKSHSKKVLSQKTSLEKKHMDRVQHFFTSNMSDDDLFFIYATLHGGPKTFFVTGDYLNSYAARLGDEQKNLFLKWQLSHQYVVVEDFKVEPPLPHSGLPQLTQTPNGNSGKFVWHLSQQLCHKPKIRLASPINWYCLQAIIRNEN